MGLVGHVDECDWDLVRGWVWDPDQPHLRIALAISVDGQPVGTIVADQPGEDLRAAGFGDGAYRFRFELGATLAKLAGDVHDIAVHTIDTGVQVDGISRLRRFGQSTLTSSSLSQTAAAMYLTGDGLEIGALNFPQWVPDHCSVRYVDRYPTDRLRAEYPEIAGDLVDVSVVDDGATLSTVAVESVDFIIANNLLEHIEDPMAAIARWHACLRTQGVLFMVVPNRRNSVDHQRANTPLSHFDEPPQVSRGAHYLDWVTHAEGLSGEAAKQRAASLDDTNYSIHFHVWDELALSEFLAATIRAHSVQFSMMLLGTQHADSETVVVLRRTA
jgi:SAM-dependent methyltransferase